MSVWRWFLRIPLLAVALLSARALAGQTTGLGHLPAQTRALVAALLDSARLEGLPVTLLEAKAVEGVAKGASGDLILSVVRDYRLLLRRSRAILGSSAPPTEMAAAAGALRSGVTDVAVAEVKRAAGDRGATAPLVVLTDLITRGAEPSAASTVIRDLTARGLNDGDFAALRRAVARDIANGRSPMQALRARAQRPGWRSTIPDIKPLELTLQGQASAPRWPASGPLGFGIAAGRTVPRRVELGASMALAQVENGTSRVGLHEWRGLVRWTNHRRGVGGSVARWGPVGLTAHAPTTEVVTEGLLALGNRGGVRASFAQYFHSPGTASDAPGPAEATFASRPDSGGCAAPVEHPSACNTMAVTPRARNTRSTTASAMRAEFWWKDGRWDTRVGVGWLLGARSQRWASLEGTRWLSENVGLRLGYAGDAISLGRGAPWRFTVAWHPGPARMDDAGHSSGRTSLGSAYASVARLHADVCELRVVSAGASSVEVRADFTQWEPVALRAVPGTGAWTVEWAACRDIHQLQIRVDHGAWTAPEGLPVSVDGFTGRVAVVLLD